MGVFGVLKVGGATNRRGKVQGVESDLIKDPPKPGGRFSRSMEYFSTLLILLWLVSHEEIRDLIDRAGSAIWDWRFLLGIFAWSAGWGYANLCKARALEDGDILQIYDDDVPVSD